MNKEIKRNDPCPCGSGKKYKQCCWGKDRPGAKKKIKATIISTKGPQPIQAPDLLERTFGRAISQGRKEELPPLPPEEDEK